VQDAPFSPADVRGPGRLYIRDNVVEGTSLQEFLLRNR